MNSRPIQTPPKRFDLVESFNALALAGKTPTSTEKKLPDIVPPVSQPLNRDKTAFVGGFSPELLAVNALLDAQRRPSLVPPPSAAPAVERDAKPGASRSPSPPKPTPQTPPKQSLTMKYALKLFGPNTNTTPTMKPTPTGSPALAPPFVTPPRPHSDPVRPHLQLATPPKSAVAGLPRGSISVTPPRPRAASVPPSPATSSTSSPGKNTTTQCSGMTKAGKQCSRQVRLPATHSHLDPIPVLYCHQHKEVMMTAQIGFYIRKARNPDKFVEFSQYIPEYLQMDTQLALRVEMEKATSQADVPGYIYTFEIRDPKRPDVIQLKVGRAVNLAKRLDQWDKQCGSKVQIPRGWWPGTVEGGEDNGTDVSLLKGNIKAGDPGPFCHRVERLVHIELADLAFNAPYLDPSWPDNTSGTLSATPSASLSSKKATAKQRTCPDCGVLHREIFAFPRPDNGMYKGKEWDLIVKPVIERWGRFIKEYYA